MNSENSSATQLHPVLATLSFSEPTPIQREAMPILANGESLLALAPTGSGKTLAFLVPLMERLDTALSETQMLILAPTRELGAQIAQVANQVALALAQSGTRPLQVRSVFGGQKAEPQKAEILRNPAVVVATPGRALELIEQDILKISALKAIVLDEADLMVGMGFEAQVKSICDHLPKRVQAALFSATESEGQSRLQNRLVHRGARVDVRPNAVVPSSAGAQHPRASLSIHETFVMPSGKDRLDALTSVLSDIAPQVQSGIIFCQTRESVQHVTERLNQGGFSVAGLSGELGQIERATILRRFKAGGVRYLVSTNLAARGIDVADLSVVIHFELPSTQQEYLHRSGRSGRAGKSGRTISLCTPQSKSFLKEILQGTEIELSEFFLGALVTHEPQLKTEFAKVHVNRGKSSKLRPGDFLGALTKDIGLRKEDVGGIFIFDHFTHIEIAKPLVGSVMNKLTSSKIKNLAVKATPASTLSAPR